MQMVTLPSTFLYSFFFFQLKLVCHIAISARPYDITAISISTVAIPSVLGKVSPLRSFSFYPIMSIEWPPLFLKKGMFVAFTGSSLIYIYPSFPPTTLVQSVWTCSTPLASIKYVYIGIYNCVPHFPATCVYSAHHIRSRLLSFSFFLFF